MNLFIHYPKCSTCQKAKKWLENNNISFTERNIIEETPTFQELKEWIERSGKEVKRFFNTSGLKYKELNLKRPKNLTLLILAYIIHTNVHLEVF